MSTIADCAHTKKSDSTLADDVVLLTILPKAIGGGDIVSWIQNRMLMVDQSFSSRGYQLNYMEGKTGMIVFLVRKSKKAI